MIVTILLNALLALPVFAVVRRLLRPVLVGRPAARAAAAARRRAPTGPLGLRGPRDPDVPRLTTARPDDVRRSWRCASRSSAASRSSLFAIIFFRLWYLQVLSGDKLPGRGQQQPRARDQGRGAARRDRRPQRPRAGGQPPGAWRSRSRPTSCPRTQPRQARALHAARRSVLGMSPRAIRARRRDAAARAAVLPGDREDRRRRSRSSRTCSEHQATFPGVDVEQVFLRKYPHHEIGAHLFGTVGEVTEEQLKEPRYRGVELGRPRRPVGHRVSSTTATCAAGTAPAASRSTRSAPDAASSRARAGAGPPAAAVDRPRRAEGGPAGARGRTAGAFVAMDVHTGEVLGARLATRPSTRTCSRRASSSRLQAPQRPGQRRAARPTARSRASIRPAPRSS